MKKIFERIVIGLATVVIMLGSVILIVGVHTFKFGRKIKQFIISKS